MSRISAISTCVSDTKEKYDKVEKKLERLDTLWRGTQREAFEGEKTELEGNCRREEIGEKQKCKNGEKPYVN